MGFDVVDVAQLRPAVGHVAGSAQDLNAQRLRILRCTAKAMATGPGGLRFTAGARPWLEDLTGGGRMAPPPVASQCQMNKHR